MKVLDNIPIELDLEAVFNKLNLKNKNADVVEIISQLVDMARSVARPKAVFEISGVDNKNGDSLHIHGVKFTSHVLRVNLDKLDTVYPYVVTCGRELDTINFPTDELLKAFFWDQIKEVAMRQALYYTHDYIMERQEC
ncbi:MAG: hypothetical protein V3V23_05080 [Dehalococcoidales bacterium]